MQRWQFRLVGPLVSLGLALLVLGSPATAQRGRFGERSDVVLVQVPVYVTRDGVPVRDLTTANFEVLEGRKKREVVAVDVYDLTLASPGSKSAFVPAPPAARRNFVLLFDLSNSLPAGIVRAREAALGLARSGLHPADPVAVVTYSQSQGIRILMNFSTDRAQLVATLDGLGLVDPFDRLRDPLRLRVMDAQYVFNSDITIRSLKDRRDGGFPNGGFRAQSTDILVSHLKDLSTLGGHADRDQVKQQVLDLAVNLDELARLLDSVSGRKQVVLFSQGFDSEIVFGTQDTARIQEMADDVELGQIWRVDSEERYGSTGARQGLLATLEDFNRSDAAIHAVDVGGLAAGGDAGVTRVAGRSFDAKALDRGHDGLFLMADQTGGEFYRNFNDLGEAMSDLLERTSLTYVVSFRPEGVEPDGSYHPIKIRLKGVGKGVEVSHRPGYYARRAFSELDPEQRRLANAELLISGSGAGTISTEMLALPFAGSDVLAVIEIDGSTLISSYRESTVPAEIYTYAFDADGRIRDFFTQAVVLDLDKVGFRLASGFKMLGRLDLPPGEYQIRTLVRNARSGDTGLAVTEVRVPDPAAAEPTLLPPLFLEGIDQWLVAWAEREDLERGAYPLMSSEGPMVPASKPRLASGRTIPVLLVGQGLSGELEAEGYLVDADGRIHRDIDVDIDGSLGDAGFGDRLMAFLTTGDIAPGDYRLVVTVRGEGEEVSSSVPVSFRDPA